MRIEGIKALNGPNVYHGKPVTVMTLRLEELTEKESTDYPGFTERLLELLPGLSSHHCSKGHEGGFVERLHERLARLKMGDPAEETTDIGPIARDDLRADLHRQVRETVTAGANCLLGGELPAGPGYFYPVTLLTGVRPEMTAAREETFGPVAVVMKVADADEALALANDSNYGLAAALWTETRRAAGLTARLETGQVAINGIVKTDPRLPSGGIKRSGIGRELGPHGIREFVNAQQVWVA